jgi:ABC-2 type transport system permease protein
MSETTDTAVRLERTTSLEAAGAGDLRAVAVVWRRELIRFFRNRARIATSLAQPVLFLFVLGGGLARLLPAARSGDVDFRTFMFPGVLAMTVLFTSIFSAVSIVWDREFGFLREMLVAPVHRGAVVLGKCLGGATVATLQGTIMLALVGLVGVPYAPLLLLTLLAEMALTSLAITAIGSFVASRMQQVEAFWAVVQFLVLPMFFLSGAVFPLSNLPAWLSWLTKFDPISYAVDPMRRAIFGHLRVPQVFKATLNPGMHWGGWRVATGVELAIVAALAVLFLAGAVFQFTRPE